MVKHYKEGQITNEWNFILRGPFFQTVSVRRRRSIP